MSTKRHKFREQALLFNDSNGNDVGDLESSKPSALYRPYRQRDWTISIAIPGSIIANAMTHDQKTALAGQIARACAVFCVDEVVVFGDGQVAARPHESGGYSAYADPDFFLSHVLSYLETPPHLRKALFAIHPDLRSAGTLPSLDMPHHLRANEDCPYREGVVVNRGESSAHTLVECGLSRLVVIPSRIERGTRVTIKLSTQRSSDDCDTTISGCAVSADTPRTEAGYYWGYNVRKSVSLSSVFTECPFDGGYDVSIGTSERGTPLANLSDFARSAGLQGSDWNHLLIVFGGVAGLEAALLGDQELLSAGVTNVSECFDEWVNLLPGQGSRTIRTEEAIWLGLMGLAPFVHTRAGKT